MAANRLSFFCFAVVAATPPGSFTVAEVKPHFQCQSVDGQERVRKYIANLTTSRIGLISLIETEFEIPQPEGYTAFGAACGKHSDPAVVLVDEEQFSVVSTIGATVAGNYSIMPYLGGQADALKNATMCISDPEGTYGPGQVLTVGSRPYAGAVLLHKASGREFCMITGTFAHCMYKWTERFVRDVDEGCGDRQLLFVVDTNAGCEIPPNKRDSRLSINEIFAHHSKADWGPCHDAGLYQEPTCCNDFPSYPYPKWWYDRTAICRGGRIEDVKVEPSFICGDSYAEHLSTTATVHLSKTNSEYCLDHPACASMGVVANDSFYGSQMLPVDGLCCPTSFGNKSLACCDSQVVV